jgi:hypothetical protein
VNPFASMPPASDWSSKAGIDYRKPSFPAADFQPGALTAGSGPDQSRGLGDGDRARISIPARLGPDLDRDAGRSVAAAEQGRHDVESVGGEEGYVRKISVRSTEVETSERARVLIPNSYFITEKVKNWTLRDNTRRIVIPVKVPYGCDPRKVRARLLKVAQDNASVMTTPAPSIDFDFGADPLNFNLYAFVDDLNKVVARASICASLSSMPSTKPASQARLARRTPRRRTWIGCTKRSPNISPVPTMEGAPGTARHTVSPKHVGPKTAT